LNPGSHHHPPNKQAILATLVHRASAVCDKESLQDELDFLKTTFRYNGCSCGQIQCAINPKLRTSKPKDKATSVAICPDYTWLLQENASQAQHLRVLACHLGRSPASSIM
jgi:hypothetical protein